VLTTLINSSSNIVGGTKNLPKIGMDNYRGFAFVALESQSTRFQGPSHRTDDDQVHIDVLHDCSTFETLLFPLLSQLNIEEGPVKFGILILFGLHVALTVLFLDS
jgi:hypothetical protein